MAKAKTGRKSVYDTAIKPHLKTIEEAVKKGATVAEIAAALGIAESTLYKYKNEKTELNKAFAGGRANIIIEIRGALLKKALGYEYEEKKNYIREEDGKEVVYTEITTKHQPPSETAGAMILRNYDETWLDKDSATTKLKQQEFELRKKIADSNNFDLE